MSRSYRKPYVSCCGKNSAHYDKTMAARSFRRKEKEAIRSVLSWEDYVHPVRLEAAHNDVWGWNRDGKQYLHFEPTFNDELHWFHSGYWTEDQALKHALDSFERAKAWYNSLKRK